MSAPITSSREPSSSNRVWRWLPEVVLVTAVLILFYRLLLGEVIFWGTPSLQFYPWREMAFGMMRSGQLPLWNPLVGSGAPLLANYQTAVLYPPNWLYLIIPTSHAMGWVGMLHLIWAGLGMIVLLRALEVDRLGQGMGALAYSLSGYLVGRFGFLSITSAVAWLPWVIWAVDRLMLNPASVATQMRSAARLALIVAMLLLAGHAQTATYCLVLAGFHALWRAARDIPNVEKAVRGAAIRSLLIALGAVVLGAALAAVQLVPTLELMQNSQRAAGLEREYALTYSFWPWRLLTLVSPNLFGTPAAGTYWGFGNYWEDAVYVGLLSLVLAARSIQRWWAGRGGAGKSSLSGEVVPFYALLLIPVTILALGHHTPLFPWLYAHIPTFDLFQAPTRWMLLAVFALSLLAGVGADRWQITRRGQAAAQRWMAAGTAILIAALYVQWQMRDVVHPTLIGGAARLGIMVLFVAITSILSRYMDRHARWRMWWEGGAFTLLAADLITAHWGLNPTISPDFYSQVSPLREALSKEAEQSRTLYAPDDEYDAKFAEFLSFANYRAGDRDHWDTVRASLLPNLGMIDHVPSANNFDPLLVGHYAALVESLSDLTPEEQTSLAARMNVSVLLTPHEREILELITDIGPVKAYRVPDPWPRAMLTECEDVSTDQFLACEPTGSGDVDIVVEGSQRIVIRLHASHPAWLLLLDTYYPGWSASLDGQAVEIQRANGAFRAVGVPAGEHEVIYEYRPRSVRIGALVTVGAIVIATTLAVLPSIKPRMSSIQA